MLESVYNLHVELMTIYPDTHPVLFVEINDISLTYKQKGNNGHTTCDIGDLLVKNLAFMKEPKYAESPDFAIALSRWTDHPGMVFFCLFD